MSLKVRVICAVGGVQSEDFFAVSALRKNVGKHFLVGLGGGYDFQAVAQRLAHQNSAHVCRSSLYPDRGPVLSQRKVDHFVHNVAGITSGFDYRSVVRKIQRAVVDRKIPYGAAPDRHAYPFITRTSDLPER